jgi:hypothetical protein
VAVTYTGRPLAERLTMLRTRHVLRGLYRGAALVAIVGTVGCGTLLYKFSGRKEACEILAIGIPATGTIVRLIDTGRTINQDPVVEFVVQVAPVEGEAYEARTKSLVSRLDVPSVQPGRKVPLKYDPRDRMRIALDLWECPKK